METSIPGTKSGTFNIWMTARLHLRYVIQCRWMKVIANRTDMSCYFRESCLWLRGFLNAFQLHSQKMLTQPSSTSYWLSIIDLYWSIVYWRQPQCVLQKHRNTATWGGSTPLRHFNNSDRKGKTIEKQSPLLVPQHHYKESCFTLFCKERMTRHKKSHPGLEADYFKYKYKIHRWPHFKFNTNMHNIPL